MDLKSSRNMAMAWPEGRRPYAWAVRLCAILVLAGCAELEEANPFRPRPQPPPTANAEYMITTPFVEAEFAPYALRGEGTISGQVFVVRPNGQVVLADRQEVVLVPWNAYTREMREAAEAGYQSLANRDEKYDRYRRTATTDADGRFYFTGLPAGDWSLMSSVVWQEGDQNVGEFIYENVSIERGELKQVVVSRRL